MTVGAEERIQDLKELIITKLKERGGDPAIRLQRVGYEAIRIASNEDAGGWDTLVLHVNGSWSVKLAMSGYSLGDKPSFTALIQAFANITNSSFDTLGETQQAAYLSEQQKSLTNGLITCLEEALQKLS